KQRRSERQKHPAQRSPEQMAEFPKRIAAAKGRPPKMFHYVARVGGSISQLGGAGHQKDERQHRRQPETSPQRTTGPVARWLAGSFSRSSRGCLRGGHSRKK